MFDLNDIPADDDQRDEELTRKRARVIFWNKFMMGMLVIYMFASSVLLIVDAIEGHYTREVLVDCSLPQGECFQEGQNRVGGIVQHLIDENELDEVATRRIVILAAACSKLPDVVTAMDVEECVNRQIEENAEKKRDQDNG